MRLASGAEAGGKASFEAGHGKAVDRSAAVLQTRAGRLAIGWEVAPRAPFAPHIGFGEAGSP